METMPLEEKTAHHGRDVCVMCVLQAKSLHLGVKLLTALPLRAQIWAHLFNELRAMLITFPNLSSDNV
jgi:hypothetical protein